MATNAAVEGDFHSPGHRGEESDVNSEIQVVAPTSEVLLSVLPKEALEFLGEMTRRFSRRRDELLGERGRFRQQLRSGERAGFLPETRGVRESSWRVAMPPRDLTDRRVEITGPPDRKMVINALNSGAQVYMADFEDSHAPTWEGTIHGQLNLRDAVRREIAYVGPDGRRYRLEPTTATLVVRPRGWHLTERHVRVDGLAVPASFFDFGLFVFHNGRELLSRGSGPYLYLPKIEHYREAELWNDVLGWAELRLGLPAGCIRVTALIETLPAAFEMEEILYALRERVAGLNGGRWDYLFSFIKQLRDDPTVRIPDRTQLPMTAPFLDAWARLLVETCHRRGAHAIGGMAAQIPVRESPERSRRAVDRVVEDKQRELSLGYDGTWVAHPGLVAPVLAVFERGLKGPNQLDVRPALPDRLANVLLQPPAGSVTPEGFRSDVRVALRYLESWFRGIGCVPIDHLMEDAATVEIARSQLWLWLQQGAALSDGSLASADRFRAELARERAELEDEVGRAPDRSASIVAAASFLDGLVTSPEFPEFFTLPAYEMLRAGGG